MQCGLLLAAGRITTVTNRLGGGSGGSGGRLPHLVSELSGSGVAAAVVTYPIGQDNRPCRRESRQGERCCGCVRAFFGVNRRGWWWRRRGWGRAR